MSKAEVNVEFPRSDSQGYRELARCVLAGVLQVRAEQVVLPETRTHNYVSLKQAAKSH
jgi:hypothetical protein